MVDVRPREAAAVFAGGCIGTLGRAEMVEAIPHAAGSWPWATFIVNIAGAFILGFLAVRFRDRPPPYEHTMQFLGTGFCGGLTTFSTLQLEVVQMLDADRILLAVVYAGGSIVAGLGAVAIARRLEKRIAAPA